MKLLLILFIGTTILYPRHIHYEKVYQEYFCIYTNGIMEYKTKDNSRIDCLLPNIAIEMDFGTKAYEGIGQALYYALITGKKPGLVLIRETNKDDKGIGIAKKLSKKYKIRLWVIDHNMKINLLIE